MLGALQGYKRHYIRIVALFRQAVSDLLLQSRRRRRCTLREIVQTHAGTDSTASGIKVGLKRAESRTHLECTLMAKMCILEHSMTQNSVSPY